MLTDLDIGNSHICFISFGRSEDVLVVGQREHFFFLLSNRDYMCGSVICAVVILKPNYAR